MKKLSTLILFSFSIIAANAQFNKGTTYVGGTISFGGNKVTGATESKNRNTYLAPSIGRFYKQNHLAGINLRFSKSKNSPDGIDYASIGGGVFIRQYLPLGKGFSVFANEGLNYTHTKSESKNTQAIYRFEDKENTVDLNFYPGLAYNITRKFQLELGLMNLVNIYVSSKRRVDLGGTAPVDTKTRSFGVTTGASDISFNSLSLGVRFLL